MSNLLFASETGKRPQIARLLEAHNTGSGFFTCEALAGWAPRCSFVVYEVDSDGNPIDGTETDWIGSRNKNTLGELELTAGVDRDYPLNRTYIVATETAGGRNKLVSGLKNTLNDNGTLKDWAVTSSAIKDGAISSNKIENGAINNDKVANNAIGTRNLLDETVSIRKVTKPCWWVVSTSDTSSITIPLGHRFYRIRGIGVIKNNTSGILAAYAVKPNRYIYTQGVSNGEWTQAEEQITTETDKTLARGAKTGVASGLQTWDINLSRLTSSSDTFMMDWTTSIDNSLSYNNGRTRFSINSAPNGLIIESNFNGTAKWVVEALVES